MKMVFILILLGMFLYFRKVFFHEIENPSNEEHEYIFVGGLQNNFLNKRTLK